MNSEGNTMEADTQQSDMNNLNSARSYSQMWQKQSQAFLEHFATNDGSRKLDLSSRSAFVLAWLYTKTEVNDSVSVPGDWQAFPSEFVNEIGNPGPLTKEDFGVRELVDKGFVELEPPFEPRLRITEKGVSFVLNNPVFFKNNPSVFGK